MYGSLSWSSGRPRTSLSTHPGHLCGGRAQTAPQPHWVASLCSGGRTTSRHDHSPPVFSPPAAPRSPSPAAHVFSCVLLSLYIHALICRRPVCFCVGETLHCQLHFTGLIVLQKYEPVCIPSRQIRSPLSVNSDVKPPRFPSQLDCGGRRRKQHFTCWRRGMRLLECSRSVKHHPCFVLSSLWTASIKLPRTENP